MERAELNQLEQQLTERARLSGLPDRVELGGLLAQVNGILNSEPEDLRPADRRGLPGGLVLLPVAQYYLVVPDLHARKDFFLQVLLHRAAGVNSVLADLAEGRAVVICVGDAFHSERRALKRWQAAFGEYINEFAEHRHMDEEMAENLGLLQMIAMVKRAFPRSFHFLKGNHENIANERGEGNYPFMKFVREGDMVKRWMDMFAGPDVPDLIYRWEKSLPLMAAGEDFLVTHAEPGRALERNEVIDAYGNPEVIYLLTWVGNDEAEPGSVRKTLENIIGRGADGRIFGGHRPVSDRYDLRQDGQYVQINTPDNHVVARFSTMNTFDPETQIYRILGGQ